MKRNSQLFEGGQVSFDYEIISSPFIEKNEKDTDRSILIKSEFQPGQEIILSIRYYFGGDKWGEWTEIHGPTQTGDQILIGFLKQSWWCANEGCEFKLFKQGPGRVKILSANYI